MSLWLTMRMMSVAGAGMPCVYLLRVLSVAGAEMPCVYLLRLEVPME